MPDPEPHHNTTPAVLGGDLPEKEQLAVEEGHDADVPTSKARQNPELGETKSEAEKMADTQSSVSSAHSASRGDVEKAAADATAEPTDEPTDPNVVDWEGPDDPNNPYNWAPRRKWANIAILSLLTLLVPLASSMFAPGVPDVMNDFGTKRCAGPIHAVDHIN